MDTKSDVKSLHNNVLVGHEVHIKDEFAFADSILTSIAESDDFLAESVKSEGVGSPDLLPMDSSRPPIRCIAPAECDDFLVESVKSEGSPDLHPTDSSWSPIKCIVPGKPEVEVYEEEEEWDPLLHTCVEIKDENHSQSFEVDDACERQDKAGDQCKEITSSQELETSPTNALICPLTIIKAEVEENNHASVNLLHVNSKITGEVISQAHGSKDQCERKDTENDSENNTLDSIMTVPVCSTEVKEEKSAFSTQVLIQTGEKHQSHTCSHCHRSFADRSNLTQHMRTHTGKKPFACSQCSASFAQKRDLTKHTRLHTGEKPFTCSHCHRSFADRSNLTRHMRTHTGEKPFACSHCSVSFAQKGDLTKHTRLHTGEKPFTCSHCHRSFADGSNLIHHMRTHTGEKPFSCSHCSLSFASGSNLTRHMLLHTGEEPFACSNCSVSFAQKTNLQVLERTHTGEANRSNLTKHMRTLMGEEPFSFSHCPRSFEDRRNL